MAQSAAPVKCGADVLVARGFDSVRGKRVGLITNHTGLVGEQHLADLLHKAPGVTLAAILAPEHGFRGTVEAGAKVKDGKDPGTGVPVLSLYGATRKPTPAMLKGIELLVFDIQDIGVRYYTYISTMALAMQAAAEAKIPFLVLDRPNPLGGEDVAGFMMEPGLVSFVGQVGVPQVHGLTVGELARMIKEERMLSGLDALDLRILAMEGWKRAMRWPETERPWVKTSPNIPSFETALVYAGIGLIEGFSANEGRGTDLPFLRLGAPWVQAKRMTDRLNAAGLSGVRFEPAAYVPRPLPGIANQPAFEGETVRGIRIVVTDHTAFRPVETGTHVLAALAAEARAAGRPVIDKAQMMDRLSGTKRLRQAYESGTPAGDIIAAWQAEAEAFKARRARHLIYP
jgi:uncharacterized protein YbbC (DUF1343 family)